MITFDTENAVFQFDRKDAVKCLEKLAMEHGVDEAKSILRGIANSRDLQLLEVQNDYFACVAIELVGSGKGSVFCKVCGKKYLSKELEFVAIGFGTSPLNPKIRMKESMINLFRKSQVVRGMFGGKSYQCPEGHNLISVITWIS